MGTRATRNEKKSNLVMRKIPSTKFLYEINSDGTIIRNVKSKRTLKIRIKELKRGGRYKTVGVHVNRKLVNRFIHSLVAECWLGPRPKGYQIDHIDRDSLNNDYRNLRYVSVSEQMKNRQRNPNVWMKNLGCVPVKVILKTDEQENIFDTIKQASIFLANEYGYSYEHFKHKMVKRRKHIYDYDVSYCRD